MTFSLSSGISSAFTVSEMTVTDCPSENVTYNTKHICKFTIDYFGMNFIFNHVLNIFMNMSSMIGHTMVS